MKIFKIACLVIINLVLINISKAQNTKNCDILSLTETTRIPSNPTLFTSNTPLPEAIFGVNSAVIGDINGDGIDDMAVTARTQDLGGGLWVMFLDNLGNVISTKYTPNFGVFNLTGFEGTRDVQFAQIKGIGDVDKDGTPDIIVSAPGFHFYGVGTRQRGIYAIAYLNSDGSVKKVVSTPYEEFGVSDYSAYYTHIDSDPLPFQHDPPFNFIRFGVSLDVIGDIDGNGVNDLIVGATLNGKSSAGDRNTQGRAYIIRLSETGKPLPYSTYLISPPDLNVYEEFGNGVAAIGDLDGDGIQEVAVSAADHAIDANSGQFDRQGKGRIFIYFLDNTGKVRHTQEIADGHNGLQIPDNYHFGMGIATIGDANCDGIPDLAVTTLPQLPNNGDYFNLPEIYILYLNNDGTVQNHQIINQTSTNNEPYPPTKHDINPFFAIDKGKDWSKLVDGELINDGINDLLIKGGTDYIVRLSFSRTCECTVQEPCQNTATLTFPTYQLKEVINTSAQTLSDNWLLSKDIPLLKTNGQRIDDLYTRPYTVGKQGIWRGESSFAYVTDRKQSTDIDLKTDGTYTLNMFNWKYLGELDCPEWRKVETVSEYHPQSSDVERYNILKLYSSFHIGYSDQLVSAAAANSKQYEFGFEGFEEYTDDIYYANANLLFSTKEERRVIPIPYWFTLETGRNRRIWAPLELQTLQNQYAFTKLHVLGKQIDVNYPGEFRSHTTFEEITIENDKSLIKFSLNEATPFEGFWTGKVGVTINKKTAQTFNGGQPKLVDGIAHTGTKSLKIDLPASFNQPYLLLIPNKKYVVSAWVRVDDADKPLRIASYEGYTNLQVEFGDRTTIEFKPEGQIIEGWQRIEGSFTVPSDGMGNWNIQLVNQKGLATYFDDIRLFPSLGNMESFVYDTETFRLEAKLDANNYATFYYYDAEGRLYLVKQETAKGVQTLQTVTTHTKRD